MSLLLALLNNGVTGTITASVVVAASVAGVVPATTEASATAGATASCAGIVPAIGQSSASVGQSCECAGIVQCNAAIISTTPTAAQCAGVVPAIGACDSDVEAASSVGGVVAIVGDVPSFASVSILIRGNPPTLSYPLSASVSDRSTMLLLADLDASASVSEPYAQFAIGEFSALAVVLDSKTGVQ